MELSVTVTINLPPILSGIGSQNYPRRPNRHPGYDPANWNHTLDQDTPLAVHEKRIQAMLYLELYLPPLAELEGSLDFTLVIPAEDMSSILVNGQPVFNSSQDRVFKIQRSVFETAGTTVVGGLADARKLLRGRRARGFGRMPEDAGYNINVDSHSTAGLLNADLFSRFFTVNRNAPLSFSSGLINLKIHNTLSYWDGEPAQQVRFSLPVSQAPVPDLVTAGAFRVNYVMPGDVIYDHPATQAPRWWGFHRDGVLGRSDGFARPYSERGRLNRDYSPSTVSNELNARALGFGLDPWAGNAPVQSVPGARALLYHGNPHEYPGVRFVPASQQEDRIRYGPREDDPLSSWDRPWHFGTDTLRTLANINRLVPKALVTEHEWIKPPGYDEVETHMAFSTGFDEPLFTEHPANQNLRVGDTAMLSTNATSTSAVNWQWRHEGQDIEGADESTLIIPNVDGYHAGVYDVVATNDAGDVTSNPALLTVETPVITAQPAGGTAYAGQQAVLSVTVLGTGNVSYQWRKNGEDIPGATSSSLEFPATTHREQAQYDVVVTDEFHHATSEAATLQVLSPAPVVTISPAGTVTGAPGAEVAFAAEITGLGTPDNITWQWRKNGVNIAKATGPALTLSNLQQSHAGVYDVVVKNIHGTALSNPVRLTMPGSVHLLSGPQDAEVAPGENVTLSVSVEGPATYQWLKNGRPVKGATGDSLAITDADFDAAGVYSVTVTTPQGKTTTAGAHVRVLDAGLLIYKLTGTGTSQEGREKRKSAFGGWLVLDRAGQRGGFLFTSASGRQKTHWTEVRESLQSRGTGPVPGSLTVVSDLAGEDDALWLSGADSLVAISKTDKTVAPKTLSGSAHRFFPGERNRVEMTAMKLVLDAAQSGAARVHDETVEQSLARLSMEMQAKGSALAGSE